MKGSAAFVTLLGIVGLLGVPLAGQHRPADPPLHLEQPDDGPAPVRAPAGATSPLSRFGTGGSIQVNIDGLGNNIPGDAANEPSIAVDMNDPNRIAIGWRQFDTVNSNFRQAGWAWTDDGGATWTFPGKIEPGIFRSDPVLDTDVDGNFYYYSLTGDFFCWVFKSTDGAQTWGPRVAAFGGDKNWFTIDKSTSIGQGNIYCAWQINGNPHSPDQFCRSTDGGASFGDLVEIPGNPIFGTLAVGPDGEVYVCGINPFTFTDAVVVRSDSARDPNLMPVFEQVQFVDPGGVFPFIGGGPNPGGLPGQVWIDVDRSNGPSRGNVYLMATVQRTQFDPMDIMVTRSTDGGVTWDTPVRVNDDPTSNGNFQWFGTMSIAPNGRIDVVFNDTRESGLENISKLYYAFSEDEGQTWSPNVPLSPPFNSHIGWPNQNKIGDYYDMVSDDTGAHLAWSATFNGEQDVYYRRVLPGEQPQPDVVSPEAFGVSFGDLVSGGIEELADSDDDYVVVGQRAAASPLLPNVRIFVQGFTIYATPAELVFTLEAAATALPANVPQKMALFDTDAGSFEIVDDRVATTTDSVVNASPANPARFIQSSSGAILAQIDWFDPGNVFFAAWQVRVDQVQWTVTP